MSESKTPRTDDFSTRLQDANVPLNRCWPYWYDHSIKLETGLAEAHRINKEAIETIQRYKTELQAANEKLAIESITEKCTQCGFSFSPSWVESGWCINCILKHAKTDRDQWRQVAEELNKELSWCLYPNGQNSKALAKFNAMKGQQ